MTIVKNALPFLRGKKAPRYTSYPPADFFSSTVDDTTVRDWLTSMRAGQQIDIYVHVPFCRKLCWFCGCSTSATKKYDHISYYVGALKKEIDTIKRFIPAKPHLKSLHFGGGSPSILNILDMQEIFSSLYELCSFDACCDMAIELDPRINDESQLAGLIDIGFNRLSIGLQDFDEIVQRAINRIQTFDMVYDVVMKARTLGITNINMDLIYGLPHQTWKGFEKTLQQTIKLEPSRLALFSYGHVPHAKANQRLIDADALPCFEDKINLFLKATQLLTNHGYVAIGMDHFARNDDPLAVAMKTHTLQRNFQGYSTENSLILLGLGSSAISRFPQGYYQNNSKISLYQTQALSALLPISRGWIFNKTDLLRKTIIDELMCYMHIDLNEVCHRYKISYEYFAPEIRALEILAQNDLINIKNGIISINIQLPMAVRLAAQVFDAYKHFSASRYSEVA